jgi:hypothetical protein
MSDFVINESQIEQFNILNKVLESNRNRFTIDSLVSETLAINSIESSIPESTLFDLHLSMILDQGKNAISDYYRGMATGTNSILEAARKVFPDSHEITESIDTFKEYLKGLFITEANMSLAPASDAFTPADLTTAFTGGPLAARTDSGFWSVLKKLYLACTENGSAIGIFQFILDIIGVVGDFIFPGVGVVADIINAIIYYIRGQYMLGTISLIAGLVVGGGDMLKPLKWGAHAASPILVKLSAGQVDDAALAVARLSTKDSGIVMRLLRKIASLIGGAIGSGTTMLGKFIQNFAKITDYIPGLGLLLRPIFEFLGKSITNFGTKMTTFCDGFKLMDTRLAKEAIEKMDNAAKVGSTFKLSDDGKLLYAFSKEGKLLGRIPSESFVKSGIKEVRYGGAAGADKLFTTAAEFAAYQKGIGNIATNPSIRARLASWTTRTLPKATKEFGTKLAFFIGKQIWKIIHGKPWTGKPGEWTKKEVEGHGNGGYNDWVDKQIKKKREETGAVYVPYVELDSRDKEAYNRVLDYQNHFAKLHGEPAIMRVVMDNYDKDKVDDEFDEFFDAIGRGEVTRGGEGDVVDHEVADNLDKDIQKITADQETEPKSFTPSASSRFSQFK